MIKKSYVILRFYLIIFHFSLKLPFFLVQLLHTSELLQHYFKDRHNFRYVYLQVQIIILFKFEIHFYLKRPPLWETNHHSGMVCYIMLPSRMVIMIIGKTQICFMN